MKPTRSIQFRKDVSPYFLLGLLQVMSIRRRGRGLCGWKNPNTLYSTTTNYVEFRGIYSMARQNDLESRALQVILDSGGEGVLQCDLWKVLDASSREGSRISIKLENKNLIRRERELRNGRWTYRVFIKRQPVDIDSILDVPCVSCDEISRCETDTEISPITCKQLDQWLGILGSDSPSSIPSE